MNYKDQNSETLLIDCYNIYIIYNMCCTFFFSFLFFELMWFKIKIKKKKIVDSSLGFGFGFGLGLGLGFVESLVIIISQPHNLHRQY